MYDYIFRDISKDNALQIIKKIITEHIQIKIDGRKKSNHKILINELNVEKIIEIEIDINFQKLGRILDILQLIEPLLILNIDLTNDEDNSIIDKPLILHFEFDEYKLFDKSKIPRKCELFKSDKQIRDTIKNKEIRSPEEIQQCFDFQDIKQMFYTSLNREMKFSDLEDFQIIQNDAFFFLSSFQIHSDKYLFLLIKKNDSEIDVSDQEIKKFQETIKQKTNNQDDIQIIYQKPFYGPYQKQTYSSLHLISEHLLNQFRKDEKERRFLNKKKFNWIYESEQDEWYDDVASIFEKQDNPNWNKSYNFYPELC